MIAAAATIAVVYPHMNSIGGDSFWLMHVPGQAPGAIDACGAAARAGLDRLVSRAAASRTRFRFAAASPPTPSRARSRAGALALRAVAARAAAAACRSRACSKTPSTTPSTASPVTRSQAASTAKKAGELQGAAGFRARLFSQRGKVPETGALFVQPRLAATLRTHRRARAPTTSIAASSRARSRSDLERIGSPLALARSRRASRAARRSARGSSTALGTLYNMTPPTQGLVSLLILGILDELRARQDRARERRVTCTCASKRRSRRSRCATATSTIPRYMTVDAQRLLDAQRRCASSRRRCDRRRAAPWGGGAAARARATRCGWA